VNLGHCRRLANEGALYIAHLLLEGHILEFPRAESRCIRYTQTRNMAKLLASGASPS